MKKKKTELNIDLKFGVNNNKKTMKKLLIATWNPAKLNMFQNLLKNHSGIEIYTLTDFEKVEEPVEDWHTVEDNALIKAKYYCEKFDIVTLADDAWFEVDELDWAPWVKARRWGWDLPDTISDDDWLDFFLDKISHIDKQLLNWCFPFSRCLYFPWWEYFFQTENISVKISKKPRRPYKKWWPLSSLVIEEDWRHHLDVPEDDPFWHKRIKKEGLIKLLEKL